jgi:hypothetical protein
VVSPSAGGNLSLFTLNISSPRSGSHSVCGKRAVDVAALAQMTVQHEPPLDRIHRALDPLDGVRQPIVEHDEPVEFGLDGVIEAAPGRCFGELAAKRVSLAKDQRLATEGAPLIAGQRIDERETPVPRIIVETLPRITHLSRNSTPLVYNEIGVYSEVDCGQLDRDRFAAFQNVRELDVLLNPQVLFIEVAFVYAEETSPCRALVRRTWCSRE